MVLALIPFLVPVVSAQIPNDMKSGQHKTIEWTELIPPEVLEILSNPPSYIAKIEDGSEEDQVSKQMSDARAKEDRYMQALESTKTKPELNGKAVRLPGFIVPLEYDDDQLITEFFLVPYFGACIHSPPPPPNQIAHVKYPKGLKLEVMYNPLWIKGTLKTALIENDMAIAAYAIDMQSYEPYTPEVNQND